MGIPRCARARTVGSNHDTSARFQLDNGSCITVISMFTASDPLAGQAVSPGDTHDAFLLSVRNARAGVQTHPLAMLAVWWSPGFSDRYPVFAATLLVLSIAAALLRLFGARYALREPDLSRRRWLVCVVAPVLLAKLLWSALVTSMLWLGELDIQVMLVLLGSVALAFGCVISYAPYRLFSVALLLIHLGLPLIATLTHFEGMWLLLALLLVAFLLYVLRMTGSLFYSYWHAVATRNHLNEALQRAEAASLAKNHFLANISHEIRTPLNGIAAPAELLQQTPLDARQRHLLNLIDSSAHTLEGLIDDLLDFAKIEAGKVSLSPRPFSIGGLVHDIVERQRLGAEAKGLLLTLHMALPEADGVLGDPLRIGQILDNVLANAIKFTDAGSISVKAELQRAEADTQLTLLVRDTGVGISAAVGDKIFSPFVQGDESATRRFGGSGLGLSISRHLAEQMGATLTFSSDPGVGSEFVLTLRLAETPPPQQPQRDAGDDDDRRFVGVRVLVAEDNNINQQVITRQLQRLGISADIVGDGEQALHALARQQYDLVFLDCQMPVLDGYQTVIRLRESGSPNTAVPVIALTAHVLASDMQRALKAGMNDYLSKPVSVQTLARTIAQWLER